MRRPCVGLAASVLVGLAALFAAVADAATLPAGFAERTVAAGVSNPTLLQIAPDGRVFVAQQNGTIRVIKDNTLLSTPFVQISGVNSANERGLQGIAFDPDYATNRYVYVYYTRSSPQNNVVGRLRSSASNLDVAEGQPTAIFTIPNRNNIFHQGGGLQVGADGKLYVAVGDHQSGSGQSLNNLWGKILRLNVPDGSIPTDNPFYNTLTGDNRAIWAYGFRNPFSMDIQPGTGRIHVNDVGDSASGGREEVNVLTRGGNFNWPSSQGPGSFFNYQASSQGGNAIVGGDFYNPRTVMFPQTYVGRYFFSDYGGGWIRSINGSGSAGTLQGFASGIGSPTDVEVHPDGSMYYTSRGSSAVRRITYGCETCPTPTPTPTSTPTPTPRQPNSPPRPNVTEPNFSTTYRGGQTLAFAGTCTDIEDGTVADEGYSWNIVFHHQTHTHPGFTFDGVRSGSFTIPTDNEWDPVQFWSVALTCTDSHGVSNGQIVEVRPVTRRLTVTSRPAGAQVAADGVTGAAPLTMDAVVGIKRILDLTTPQLLEATPYFFESWSDGGAKRHDIVMPDADAIYTAQLQPGHAYRDVPPFNVTASTSDSNVPANAVDGNLATRWSGNGDGAWLQIDLAQQLVVGHVSVAAYQGTSRRNRFDIQLSIDGLSWTTVFSGETSGTTLAEQPFDFVDSPARFVRYVGHGSNVGTFNSVTEISVFARPLEVPPNTILITSTGFVPDSITVNDTDIVAFWNRDSATHHVRGSRSIPPFSFDSGPIAPGGAFTTRVSPHGGVGYSCILHPEERGLIHVRIATPTPTPIDPTPTRTPTPTPSPTATPTRTPTPTPTACGLCPTMCTESTVFSATASTNDGNVPANAIDNDLATRWSGNGDGATLTLDLGQYRTICYVKVAFYQGDTRRSIFDLQSSTGGGFMNLLTGVTSSGTTLQEETFEFHDTIGRMIRFVGHGNTSTTKPTWNSVTEISVFTRPTPMPTPFAP